MVCGYALRYVPRDVCRSIGAAELYGGVAARASEVNSETKVSLLDGLGWRRRLAREGGL